MKNLAFIPARGGSKGVPGKNMRLINGKPLLFYTFSWARDVGIFDEIFISTDCPITLEYGLKLGATSSKLRIIDNNLDKQSAVDLIISHQQNNSIELKNYDFLWYLQPTSPIRDLCMAKKTLDLINKNKDLDSLLSFIEVPDEYNSEWQFKLDTEGYVVKEDREIITRRQDLPKRYIRDGRFYITKVSSFLNNKKLIGDKCIPIILEANMHVNIDSIDDWYKAKKVCQDFF